MTVALKRVGAITLFVEDLQRSRLFYQDVFGLQVIYEDENSVAFDFENTIINLLSIPAARELIEPGAVASPEAGSRLQFTIGSMMRMQHARSWTRAAWRYSTAR